MQPWPEWWQFEIVVSSHVLDRMEDRDFTEVDLRAMLEDASGYRPSVASGRFIIESRRAEVDWEVIVEPDMVARLLIVVTAYEVE